ncbi:MucR family transcriptional regulator [Sphingomonas nostoxanthinifaciens]|uniref:MucR family transcriptional regulator n=1 Tax=Sphingomonas nostoxanthinifaciens TaxID=2872652 RepID=UPI001CC1D49C|nr:MucR family transcriptional regulator [Sphingomonas nostoxanthinifaciens]UAK25271.1 MucR family transcriptional regulator [Sphingomonas nostoxanthinifaciens]
MADGSSLNFVDITADIAAAYLGNNQVRIGDVGGLIATIHGALKALESESGSSPIEEPLKGAVSARKSLADPERVISMIDGKAYTTLKRHITRHGYTPDSYRAAFGLPASYPMTASGYSERRREIAKTLGLGKRSASAIAEPEATPPAPKRQTRAKGAAPAAEPIATPAPDTVTSTTRRRLKIKTA